MQIDINSTLYICINYVPSNGRALGYRVTRNTTWLQMRFPSGTPLLCHHGAPKVGKEERGEEDPVEERTPHLGRGGSRISAHCMGMCTSIIILYYIYVQTC